MTFGSRRDVKKVLIANRGEIALRAVHVCHSLGLVPVAVYSSADAAAPHVWAASEAVCIGPPPSSKSYLNATAILHVAETLGCDAIYPGYGFLSENALFAQQCSESGLIFIGPEAETIRIMGDKAAARQTALKYDVPVVPGSRAAFTQVKEAGIAAENIGFPILIKASAGGGGRGMRVANSRDDFDQHFVQASREAEQAFGDPSVYLERFVSNVRHIEVQILGDGNGNAVHLGERDCTAQRRHQKLVEEAPSPVLTPPERKQICDSAVRLACGVKYRGAGTVEFIFDPYSRESFFIEMNTRIQVEHPVTEMLVGADLVAEQFKIASGNPISVSYPDQDPGHAIEFRINAEDFTKGFQPSPGRIVEWAAPRLPGVRLDSAFSAGAMVVPFYDSMLAKLVVHGRSRDDALMQARRALALFKVSGIKTTIGLHRNLLDHDDFKSSKIHTKWIEEKLLPTSQENEK